jgi:hypothetical protein
VQLKSLLNLKRWWARMGLMWLKLQLYWKKHLQAQGDKPPSKKRLREDNMGEVDVEGISMYGGSLSLERKKKRGDIESQLEKSTNGLAAAGDQPRRSL